MTPPEPNQAVERVRDLHARGRFAAALREAEAVLARAPGHPPLTALRISCLLNLSRPREAARAARRALRHTRHPAHRSVLAAMLIEADAEDGRFDEAERVAAEERAERPDDPLVASALARALLLAGRRADALEAVLGPVDRGVVSVALAAAFVEAARHSGHAPRAEAAALQALERDAGAPPEARASLHAHLGLMLDDAARYDDAFAHAAEANRLAPARFDDEAAARRVERIRRLYTPEALAAAERPTPPQGPRPVFIVGMPRSGTTLTERIIASHPDAAAGGELPDLARIAAALAPTWNGAADSDPLDPARADPAAVARCAAEYRARLAEAAGPGTFRVITDKTPANFWLLGFIAHALPDALVIHCRRHPADTCLSCFMQPLNAAHTFASDLRSCAAYFRRYLDAVAHYRALAADPRAGLTMLEIDYETTVADPESQARTVLGFLGLPFHEACLRPHESGLVSNTLSSDQVRRPIFATAVARHRHYAAHLGPLIEALADAEHPPATPPPRAAKDPQP